MKAQIHITGQIGGNFRLLNALSNYTQKENGMFNSFYVHYDTIGEAKKAMRAAWKEIKNIDDNTSWHDGLSKDLCTLSYDASTARLNKIQG
jgi:hypothetical protein